jgi:hypothetical protein
MTEEPTGQAKKWVEDAEEAINKATEALRAAWEGTREVRMSTLQSAKDAAAQLGKAIDQGIEAARQSWDSGKGDTAQGEGAGTEEE